MNRYGQLAQEMWGRLAPGALAEIEDPSRHFSTLGEEAQEQVTSLTVQLTGPDIPGETYFAKVGRINNAKLRAEEMVREDLLLPPRELWETEDEEPDLDLGLEELAEAREMLRELKDEPTQSQP